MSFLRGLLDLLLKKMQALVKHLPQRGQDVTHRYTILVAFDGLGVSGQGTHSRL